VRLQWNKELRLWFMQRRADHYVVCPEAWLQQWIMPDRMAVQKVAAQMWACQGAVWSMTSRALPSSEVTLPVLIKKSEAQWQAESFRLLPSHKVRQRMSVPLFSLTTASGVIQDVCKTSNVRITLQSGAFANHCCCEKAISVTCLSVCARGCGCVCACSLAHPACNA
jgi:hypothetical protein